MLKKYLLKISGKSENDEKCTRQSPSSSSTSYPYDYYYYYYYYSDDDDDDAKETSCNSE